MYTTRILFALCLATAATFDGIAQAQIRPAVTRNVPLPNVPRRPRRCLPRSGAHGWLAVERNDRRCRFLTGLRFANLGGRREFSCRCRKAT